MATFPSAVISLTNPSSTDKLNSPDHATQHSNANDEIEAIETELGVDPAGSHSTVVARLNKVDTWSNVIYHTVVCTSTVITTAFWRAPYACSLSGYVQATAISTATTQHVYVAHTSAGDNALAVLGATLGAVGTVGLPVVFTASATATCTAGEVMRFVVAGSTATAQTFGITLVLAKTDTT